jgi:short subunit dehydrogenase-like uncharacterized protein
MWAYPWIMGKTNSSVVARSNNLLGFCKDFTYNESCSTGSFFKAFFTWFSFAFFVLILHIPFMHPLIKKFGAHESEPNRGLMQKGSYVYEFHASDHSGHKTSYFRIFGRGDHTYFQTAIMSGESAVCLAKNYKHFAKKGGIYTPMSGMGDLLVDRLASAKSFLGDTMAFHFGGYETRHEEEWEECPDVVEELTATTPYASNPAKHVTNDSFHGKRTVQTRG